MTHPDHSLHLHRASGGLSVWSCDRPSVTAPSDALDALVPHFIHSYYLTLPGLACFIDLPPNLVA